MSSSASGRYPVPAAEHRAEQVIQRSRFITTVARAATADEAAEFVRRVSAEFADATHNCWAFVVGPPGSTGRVGMSDDGEPHGTAGRPMLNVLLHAGVGDVAAVVTRYFGGTKLGTGGLVRAYGGSLQQALATLPLTERVTYAELAVTIDYAAVSAVQQLLPAHEGEVVSHDYAEAVTYRVRLPEGNADAFRAALLDATRGRAVLGEGDG
jgi:uncharacterized YigZ family protein